MNRVLAEITEHEEIGSNLFFLKIRSQPIASSWIPGQFVHILPPVFGDRPPMLRRPVSILASKNDQIELIYRVVGEGTALISRMKKSEVIDTIGPLGTGFVNVPAGSKRHILIGGGIGSPPIIALARFLHVKNVKVELFQGAKNSQDLILHNHLKTEGYKYLASTNDGSAGFKGLITDILPKPSDDISCACACGPVAMLKAIFNWRGENKFPFYVSVENKMGCGVGVCLGCSIPTNDGYYIRTCKNGPVFDANIIDWDKM